MHQAGSPGRFIGQGVHLSHTSERLWRNARALLSKESGLAGPIKRARLAAASGPLGQRLAVSSNGPKNQWLSETHRLTARREAGVIRGLPRRRPGSSVGRAAD